MSGGPPAAHDPRRGRRVLLLLAGLFFVPLGVSVYLYYGHSALRPAGTVNHGELVEPPRPLPRLALPLLDGGLTAPDFLTHKWTLLYVGPGVCGARCRVALYDTRQIRTALNRDMSRVQRVFLATGDCCDADFLHRAHPDLLTVRATATAAPLLAALPRFLGTAPADAGRVYLVDPNGNLMMSYPPDARPKGILEDMKRLLLLSNIG
jgi:hypothetical protein